MTLSRGIPFSVHGAIEMLAAPAVMAAPFLLGFGPSATIAAILIGALMLGLATQVEGGSTIPLSAHAGFDYLLATFSAMAGLVIGIANGAWNETIFLVGVGVAQVAMTASTRFSAARGV